VLGTGLGGWTPNQSKCEVNGSGLMACDVDLHTVETAAWAIVYGPGLDSLSSQAEKLFRSGLIVVGPDWLNETLRRGLVLRPRVDLVLVDFPAGSWHC